MDDELSDSEILMAFRAAETVPRSQINYDLLGYALSEFAWGGSLDDLLRTIKELGGTPAPAKQANP